jgi:hypothetical protein
MAGMRGDLTTQHRLRGRRRGRGRRHGLGPAAALVVVLAVVGGLPGSAGAGERATKSKATTTTTVPRAVAAEAKAALLTLPAFPTGWLAASSVSGPSRVAPVSRQLASCIGAPKKLATEKPVTYSSPDFTNSEKTLAVEDNVSLYSSAAQARAAHAAVASTKTPTCMNSLGSSALRSSIQKEAGSGTTVGTVSITALPKGTLETGESGFEVSIPLTAGGKQLEITSIQVDFVKGALAQQLTFNGNGTTFPALLEVQLVQAAIARS